MVAKITSILINFFILSLALSLGAVAYAGEATTGVGQNQNDIGGVNTVAEGIGLPIVEVKTNGNAAIGIYKSDGITTLSRFISEAIKYVSVLAMVAITWGGITYITAYGDEKKVGKAKNIIIYSLLAVLLAISAYAIIDIINNIKVK